MHPTTVGAAIDIFLFFLFFGEDSVAPIFDSQLVVTLIRKIAWGKMSATEAQARALDSYKDLERVLRKVLGEDYDETQIPRSLYMLAKLGSQLSQKGAGFNLGKHKFFFAFGKGLFPNSFLISEAMH